MLHKVRWHSIINVTVIKVYIIGFLKRENDNYIRISIGLEYFSAECSDKGGSSSGSCADGFGVCCTCKYIICVGD